MDTASTMSFLDRLLGRSEPANPPYPLHLAAAGRSYRVRRIGGVDPLRSDRLAALGLLAGATLVLRQRRPAFVIELGETTLALDADLAACIEVEPA